MHQLFLFFYNYRAFFTFILLELVAGYLIVTNNQYQSSAFYNSANSTVGSVLEFSNSISQYFDLKEVNKDLADENAELKARLEELNQKDYSSVSGEERPEVISQFMFKVGKVINNTTKNVNNYLTLNKGALDGVKPGMGVVGPTGVVGKVKNTSDHFSTVTSVLHYDNYISSKHKKSGSLCTTKWNGKDPTTANLIFLPKHIKIEKGDTVVTSGANVVFPEGVMIGIVEEVRTDVQVESVDRITINLTTDFNNLQYVYIVDNKLRNELDSLNAKTGVEK